MYGSADNSKTSLRKLRIAGEEEEWPREEVIGEGSQRWEAGFRRQSTSFEVPLRAAPGVSARATPGLRGSAIALVAVKGGEHSGALNKCRERPSEARWQLWAQGVWAQKWFCLQRDSYLAKF